jgi:putative selenium metabolism hydrolase
MGLKEDILNCAKKYEPNLIKFMRDLISIPSESCNEKNVVKRIKKEMKKVGFDKIFIDKMGNIIGQIGNGKKIIAMDAHIDTVGIGSLKEWNWDPYKGKFENGIIYGRGASDQKAGMVSMVYAGKIIKDLKLLDDYTLYIVGSVQEENCDGLCWQFIINEDKIKPDCVIITEPTNLNIYRGHRGRMEIAIRTFGISAHASAPERGKNAISMMANIIQNLDKLNTKLKQDKFLGKGSLAVTYIDSKSPSLCAIPNECYIHIDRRLTKGETKNSVINEIKKAISKTNIKDFSIEILKYEKKSWRGLVYPTEKYYPTWVLDENHPLCKKAVQTYITLFDKKPLIGKWTFSTNGVATMGMFKIPTIGFGPGNEIYAHSVNDQVSVEHLIKASAFYALFPKIYLNKL